MTDDDILSTRTMESGPLPRNHLPPDEQTAMRILDEAKAGESVPLKWVNDALRLTGDLVGQR